MSEEDKNTIVINDKYGLGVAVENIGCSTIIIVILLGMALTCSGNWDKFFSWLFK